MNGWCVLGGLVAFYGVAWLCQMFYQIGWNHGDKVSTKAHRNRIKFLESVNEYPCDRDYI